VRWQPITPALVNCLTDHATTLGAILPTDPLLRFRPATHHPTLRPLVEGAADAQEEFLVSGCGFGGW